MLLQINKSTAPEQLRMWRHTSKCHPLDFYVGRQRIIHMRNVLIQVRTRCSITPAPTVTKLKLLTLPLVCSACLPHALIASSKQICPDTDHQVSYTMLQGPRDVYLGLAGAVLGTLPTALVYFSTYEVVKARLERTQCKQAVTHLLSASAGAVLSAVIKVLIQGLAADLLLKSWSVVTHVLR